MRTLIAIPCMDEIPYQFVESLIALNPIGDTTVRFLSGSLVYEARNNLLKCAIDQEYDYILWLDSDMTFESDLLQKMFDAIGDNDFLAVPYFSRRFPHNPTVYSKCGYIERDEMMECEFEYVREFPNDVFEIAACGFGCVLMKTKIGIDILQNQGLPFAPLPGFGEDLSFCIKARMQGYHLFMDPRIPIGHIGTVVINRDFVTKIKGIRS